MAENVDTPKRRTVKKAETVREKTEKAAADSKKKPRRLQATTRKAGAPVRQARRGLGKLGKFKPFRIIGLILVPPYFRNSWKELKQVTWPKRRESFRLMFAVVAFAAVFGSLVAALDFGLDKVFKEVLLK
jgi:preprotein translocase SecE subunit